MSGIKLRSKVTKEELKEVVLRPDLYASKCDCCGLVYEMDGTKGILSGTFDKCATDNEGKGMGNMFRAMVCSFKCAHEMMNDGWKKMKEYKPYKRAKATLYRCEVGISEMMTEKEIVQQWEESKNRSEFIVLSNQ